MAAMSTTRENRLIALFLVVITTAALHFASRTEGFSRDEGYYFDAAELHQSFYDEALTQLRHGSLRGFARPSVDRYFGYNHEHPPLMKTLYGLSWRLLHKCNCPSQGGRHPQGYSRRHATLELMSEAAAFRFPAHLFAGILAALTFLFGTHAFSRRAGLVAAVLAVAVPRYFFHAQISCFDAPVATTWLATIYCYWRSLGDRRYALWAGISLGLAFATKHNGFFPPFVILAHYLWMHRRTFLARIVPPIPPAFAYMIVVAPIVYFASWPWLWYDTVPRFREYLAFHLHHVYYNFEYLGTNYNKPPFPRTFPFVMLLLTAPVTTMALALIGVVSLLAGPRLAGVLREKLVAARKETGNELVLPPPPPVRIWQPAPVGLVEREQTRPTWANPTGGLPRAAVMLIVLNALFPPAIIALTGAPIFGETKHFLACLPFLALLAGVGADALFGALSTALGWKNKTEKLAFAAAFVILCAPAVAETWRAQPYGLSHYNLIAGGPAGGADLGMNRQFWGYSTRGLLPWLDAHVPRNGQIYWHDTNQAILNMNMREGLMRDDTFNTPLEEPGVKASSTALVIHEKHFNKYEYWIWDFYGTARPSTVLTMEGVPLVTVYQRPELSPNK